MIPDSNTGDDFIVSGSSRGGRVLVGPYGVPQVVLRGVSLAEVDQELSVLQKVDEDIHRAIQIGQEAGEGTGTF